MTFVDPGAERGRATQRFYCESLLSPKRNLVSRRHPGSNRRGDLREVLPALQVVGNAV